MMKYACILGPLLHTAGATGSIPVQPTINQYVSDISTGKYGRSMEVMGQRNIAGFPLSCPEIMRCSRPSASSGRGRTGFDRRAFASLESTVIAQGPFAVRRR